MYILFNCADLNQIAVSQNAADAESPLDCSPECPQVGNIIQ